MTGWGVRLLLVSDFSGGRSTRRVLQLTDAGVDSLLAALSPVFPEDSRVQGPGTIGSLADFHPDSWKGALEPQDVDEILHARAFQDLEAAWRGLQRVATAWTRAVEVEILDVTRADLAGDPTIPFHERRADPLERRTAILLNFDIGPSAVDGSLFRRLAEEGARWRIPILAHASAGLLGAKHPAHAAALPDPSARLDQAWGGGWRALRESDASRWFGVTFNRFLLRPPYGAATDRHEESVSPARPESSLWGRGIWLAAIDLIRSFERHGHPLALGGISGDRFHPELPRWSWTAPGRAEVISSLEAAIDMAEVELLVRAGLSPLMEPMGAGSVVLPMLVNAHREDPTRLPVDGTLAHSLVVARFVGAAVNATRTVPAGDDDRAAADRCRRFIAAALAPVLPGDASQDAVAATVEARDGGEVLTAAIRGDLTGAGRSMDVEVSIPIERRC